MTAIFEELEAYAGQHRGRAAASPLMFLADEEFRDTDVDVVVGVPISRAIDEIPDIRVRDVEGCRRWPA